MNKIQVLNVGHPKYRLGDAIMQANNASRHILHEKFRGTIGYEYVKKSKSPRDVKRVNELVEKHIKLHNYKVPDDDEVVVHLRMGDAKLIKGDAEFARLVDLIEDAARGFSDKITIVTAIHAVANPKKSDYQIVDRLCEKMSVTIKSSANVDEDFCYLARAKKLIVTKGNFSNLAGLCNPNSVVRFDGRSQQEASINCIMPSG